MKTWNAPWAKAAGITLAAMAFLAWLAQPPAGVRAATFVTPPIGSGSGTGGAITGGQFFATTQFGVSGTNVGIKEGALMTSIVVRASLEITNASSGASELYLKAGVNAESGLRFQQSETALFRMYANSDGDTLRIYDSVNAQAMMSFFAGGRITLNANTTISSNLTLNGPIHFAGGLFGSNTIPWITAGTNFGTLLIGSGLSLTAGTLSATGSGTGDVFGPASVNDRFVPVWGGPGGDRLTNTSIAIYNAEIYTVGGTPIYIGVNSRSNWVWDIAGNFVPTEGYTRSIGTAAAPVGTNFVDQIYAGRIGATGEVRAASFASTNVPGVAPGSVALTASNQVQSATVQAGRRLATSSTNILGVFELSAASVIEHDANQIHRQIVTNRISAAPTLVLTNGSTGQFLSGTIIGEASGGTPRALTIVPNTGQLIGNLNDFSGALATSYSETITNGNALTYSGEIVRLNGTNVILLVTRQFKF